MLCDLNKTAEATLPRKLVRIRVHSCFFFHHSHHIKSASIILLNNDFSSIPVAIELGRLVFDNLKKVILYLMPVSNNRSFFFRSCLTKKNCRPERIQSSLPSLRTYSWACSLRLAPTFKFVFPLRTMLSCRSP